MGLESFREAGWFNKPIEVNFDLTQEQLKLLKNGKTVEVRDKGSLFALTIRKDTNLATLTAKDLIIERLG